MSNLPPTSDRDGRQQDSAAPNEAPAVTVEPQVLRRTLLGKIAAGLSIALGLVYLVNPTAGVLELIPDITPLIGNLDEATAMGLLTWGLSYYGIDIFRARGNKK